MMKSIIAILLSVGLIAGVYFGKQLHDLQSQQTIDKEYLAELNAVNYGLFNLQLWKEKAMNIFQGKMTDFEVDQSVYQEVEGELNAYLLDMYRSYLGNGRIINQFVDQAQKEGKLNEMFAKMIKQNVGPAIAGLGIEKQLPGIAKELTAELKKREPELKDHMAKGFKGILDENIKTEFTDPRTRVYSLYEQKDLASTNSYIKKSITDRKVEIKSLVQITYGILLLIGLLSILFFRYIGGKISITFLTLTSIAMLFLGVTMPMINIDARLNEFTMYVLDHQIGFDEQYLYFQSKSILDVTRTMIENGGWDLKVVGIMVLCFSVIIPLIKLVLTGMTVFIETIRKTSWVNKMIYHLGKWSMADVFVVALFMAYIGFQGIISTQLSQIERNDTGFAIETINYSELAPGALFFTTYCILSIISGIIIKKYNEGIDS